MVTLLLIALAIFSIIGIGLYLWQRSAVPSEAAQVLPPPPNFRGLFDEGWPAGKDAARKLALAAHEDAAASLIARAQNGERSVLEEANKLGDPDLYDRVLSELVKIYDSDPKLLSLMSHVAKNNLPVNTTLAAAAVASWQKSPDRHGTSKALHLAALSDNAELYRQTVESLLQLWREGELADISAIELRALFDGEFWILSARTRSSGAGFVLKQSLDSARRELEAAASIGSPGDQPNEAVPHGQASDT